MEGPTQRVKFLIPWAAHSRLGRQAGMSNADVERIVAGPESGGGDPVETALLRATDELYRDDVVSAETWAALAAALETKQLLDLLIAVGGYRAVSMAIDTAGCSSTPTWRIFGFRRRCVRAKSPRAQGCRVRVKSFVARSIFVPDFVARLCRESAAAAIVSLLGAPRKTASDASSRTNGYV